MKDHMLIACTETNTREEIEALAEGLMAAANELAAAEAAAT
jgi:glycine cleavage system protein P-like pyridoxal-binding family